MEIQDSRLVTNFGLLTMNRTKFVTNFALGFSSSLIRELQLVFEIVTYFSETQVGHKFQFTGEQSQYVLHILSL